MAISFPSNPSDGDIYSAVGRTWQYNATAGAWESLSEQQISLNSLGIANHDNLLVNASGEFGNALLPDTDVTYDLGSATKKWRDLYLSGNSIQLGTKTITQDNIPEVDLAIAPEILEIQVAAPAAGQDTAWLWTWEQSTLPYARRTITNSPEVSVPLYRQGQYVINNFAAYDLFGSMTQTHSLYLKWIDGAGTDNLVSWATSAGPISDSHPDINGGAATDVQRLTVNVPATITPPTLTAPSVSYTVTNNGVGAYTFSGSASGDNPNIGPFYRGGTYTFNITATGHPFYLTTDNGTNYSAGTYFGEYTNGVTGSRTENGTLTITVPVDAPDTLYYQCGAHGAMRGAITVKNLAVETNINGNYVVYMQHTQEGHKTPVELRPIPSLVNQMCLVYDASVNKFVPQDLATYVENTPSFENKIREVAGTAELVVEDGSAVIAKVNVYDDSTYLPLTGNNAGDQAFATDTNILYIWDGSAWQQAGTNNTDDLTEGSTNLFYTDSRVGTYLSNNGYDTATNIVATITASAPTTLDTLNELAAALGDDPNFATTVTNQIAAKLSTADFDSTFDTRLATKTTDDVTEGTNLYHTTARVQGTAINAGSLRGSVNNATVQYGTSYSGTPLQGSFFFDSLNQKLKVYTGSAFVDAVPAGTGGGTGSETDANTTFEKYTYTITSTTNAVTGADDNANTLAYVTDGTENVEVFVNGIKQVEGASNDYVATTGTSVTFTFNLTSGDVVEVQVYALLTNDAYYLKSEVYTKAETNTQISTGLAGLVDTAPTTLDTLNELAAALGDDPNFATTVTNSIADKLPLSGGTITSTGTISGGVNLSNSYFTITDNSFSLYFDNNEIWTDAANLHVGNRASNLASAQILFSIGASGASNDKLIIRQDKSVFNSNHKLVIPQGTVSNRPASGDSGAVYWNTSSSSLDIDNGTDWLSLPISNYQGMLNQVDLDTPSGAYSLRKLDRNYGGACMQVTDGTATTDIYFDDNGLIDVQALEDWAVLRNSQRLGVRIWYDQSGSGKNAYQYTASNRPYIVNGQSVVRAPNGMPAIKFDGDSGTDYFNIDNQISGNADAHLHIVCNVTSAKEHYLYSAGYNSNNADTLFYMNTSGGTMYVGGNNGQSGSGPTDTAWPTAPVCWEYQYDHGSTNFYMYAGNTNNTATVGVNMGNTQYIQNHHIGWAVPRNKATAYFEGHMQELVYWGDSMNLNNMQNTMNNANDFWKIDYVPSNPNAATSTWDSSTNETLHTITSSTKVENVLNQSVTMSKLLMVAGGGGGGCGHTGSSLSGGGGGAGGLIYQTSVGKPSGTYTITVGAGGAGADGPTANGSGSNDGFPADTGANGSNTTGFGYTAIGGGGGGTRNAHENGKDGGSGGGACGTGADGVGGSGTVGQGNDGGDSNGAEWGAAGGGGAGQVGESTPGGAGDYVVGNGGNGLSYDISGSATYYAGGGGGGQQNTTYSTDIGTGGLGGGGRGGYQNETSGENGTDGLGGGGGGAPAYSNNTTGDSNGGDGGDGIVIFRVGKS